jgi:hypothetical protein
MPATVWRVRKKMIKYGMELRDWKTAGTGAGEFGVQAIPHSFTMDADGVPPDEHMGDASIEGELKKLVGRARESQAAGKTAQ